MVKQSGTVMTDTPACRFDQVNVTVTLKRNLPYEVRKMLTPIHSFHILLLFAVVIAVPVLGFQIVLHVCGPFDDDPPESFLPGGTPV